MQVVVAFDLVAVAHGCEHFGLLDGVDAEVGFEVQVEVEELVEGGRAKKRYSVTDAGRVAFDRWMRDPITASDLETAAMSKTFFLALVPALDERLAVLDDIIERATADTAELEGVAVHLDSFQVPAEHADAFRFQRATLAYGIGAHRYAVDFYRALRDQVAAVR